MALAVYPTSATSYRDASDVYTILIGGSVMKLLALRFTFIMPRAIFAVILSAIVTIYFSAEAFAQRGSSAGRGALIGGATGALIGGATSSRTGRGAAIGGAIGLGVGSLIGAQMDHRRGNYWWYNGRCWLRSPNGEFHPVSHRYC
jgi:hypothetical protein